MSVCFELFTLLLDHFGIVGLDIGIGLLLRETDELLELLGRH